MATPARETDLERARGLEAVEMDLMIEALYRHYGYDFRDYALPLLKRKIRATMQAEKLRTISGLEEQVLHDPACLQRLLLNLSSTDESLYADPSAHLAFRRHVVPLLRTYPSVRIWLAGCSTGQQAYELAIVLTEEEIYDRCRIYATDLSELALDRARSGRYPLTDPELEASNYLAAGGTSSLGAYRAIDGATALLDSALRDKVLFAQHNPAADGPFNQFHAIVCRDVITLFNATLQDRVQELFRASLVRLGFLCLGRDDAIICPPSPTLYDVIDPVEKIYRRVR